jgi:hypothetical protein
LIDAGGFFLWIDSFDYFAARRVQWIVRERIRAFARQLFSQPARPKDAIRVGIF